MDGSDWPLTKDEHRSLVDIGPPGTVAGPFGMSAPNPVAVPRPSASMNGGGHPGAKGGPPLDMRSLPPWAVNVHMAQSGMHPGMGPPGGMHPGMMGGYGSWGDMGYPRRGPMIEGVKLFVGNLPLDTSEEELRSVFGTYGTLNAVMLLDSKAKSGSKSRMKCAFVFFADADKAQTAVTVMNGSYKFGDSDEAVSVQFARSDDRRGFGKSGGGGGGFGAFGGGGFGSRKGGGGGFGKGMDDWGAGSKGGYEQPQPGYGPGFQYPTTQPASKPSQYHEKPDTLITRNAAISGGKPSEAAPGEKKPATKLFVGNLPHDIDEAAMNTVFGSYGSLQCIFIMHGGSSSQQACAFVEYNTEYEAKTAINTLDGKYEIRPGEGPITVREATKSQGSSSKRPAPY